MAFKLSDVGGYGTGALGDITNPSGQINSYANVTAIATNQITIGTPINGIYEKFVVGSEIMLHVSAVASGTPDLSKLGKNVICKITAVSGSVLTLSIDPVSMLSNSDLTNFIVQVLTIPQFNTLTLSGTIEPLAYSVANKYGGILAFKCKSALNFSSGAIVNTTDKGIPIANKTLRPLTAQESEVFNTGLSCGWENHITKRQLLLNAGNGIVWFAAKAFNIADGNGSSIVSGSRTTNRIGGAVNYYKNTNSQIFKDRYPYYQNQCSSTSGKITPDSTINGGSTIFIVSDSMTCSTPNIASYFPDIFCKGRVATDGQGVGRLYIATNTPLPSDEYLFSQDCISDPIRLKSLGIKDFGTGILGDITNPSGCVNSYASISNVNGKTLTISNPTIGIYDNFTPNTEVMFHISACTTNSETDLLGKFFISKILSVSGSIITIADAIPYDSTQLSSYNCQLITIPQFGSLTLTSAYDKTLAWDATKKIGGMCVLKVKENFNNYAGGIELRNKGLPRGFYFQSNNIIPRPYLVTQCSGKQSNYIPISQGGGATVVIAKKLTVNTNANLGNIGISGASYGGAPCPSSSALYGNIFGGNGVNRDGSVYCGSTYYGICSGPSWFTYTCEGYDGTKTTYTSGGPSLFVVADEIVNFRQSVFSTGGEGGAEYPGYYAPQRGSAGGSGYAGGGSYTGGSCSGTCFIYVNKVTNPDYTGVVI